MSSVENSESREAGEVFSEVANNTLGDWAMMLTEDTTTETISEEDLNEGFITSLTLKGPKPGEINILATKQFALTLYQNLAGEFDDSVPEEELMDCLKEMTNVTAGKLISEVFGESAVYDLTELSCQFATEESIKRFFLGETRFFLLGDDCPVGFSLSL